MTCERCGEEIRLGSWPFCPHGAVTSAAVIDDQLEGGPRFFEHLGHEPVWIETKSQLKAELDKRNLRLMDKWGGESDRHLSNWAAAIDAQTLENVRALLSRRSGSGAVSPPSIPCETAQFTIRPVKLGEL